MSENNAKNTYLSKLKKLESDLQSGKIEINTEVTDEEAKVYAKLENEILSDNATKPRDVRQIKLRMAEWRSEAFSRDELYQDCETLIAAYDALQKQLEEMKEVLQLDSQSNEKTYRMWQEAKYKAAEYEEMWTDAAEKVEHNFNKATELQKQLDEVKAELNQAIYERDKAKHERDSWLSKLEAENTRFREALELLESRWTRAGASQRSVSFAIVREALKRVGEK